MSQPRVLILRAPGTNCDQETAQAFELAGGLPERLHVNRLLDEPRLLAEFQILCLPGGFSYGDDIGAGRILGSQIEHRLTEHFAQFKEAGKLILGICNGFQILMKSGILLPGDAAGPPATLTWNDSGRFEARWVELRADAAKSVFFAGIEQLELPMAHAEGKFVTRDAGGAGRAGKGRAGRASLSGRRRRRSRGLSGQSERLAGRHRRHLRRHGPRLRFDAPSGTLRRSDAASDAGRGAPSAAWETACGSSKTPSAIFDKPTAAVDRERGAPMRRSADRWSLASLCSRVRGQQRSADDAVGADGDRVVAGE